MYQFTGVVKHLIIINVLMFLGTYLMGEPRPFTVGELMNPTNVSLSDWGRMQLALFMPGFSPFFQPYQVVTHMFMHGDFGHLLFNMFAVWMFGTPIEQVMGPKKFLTYYFLTGFGAMCLHLFVQYLEIQYTDLEVFAYNVPMLGASGAVFGLLAAFGMIFPNQRIMLLIPPIPMKAKYFVIGYAVIELFAGLGPFQTGVAHFAHLGGALFGVLLLLYWRQPRIN